MTVIQKQCLLTYLGYDTGGVDGIWGEKSREATVSFQKKQGLQADGIFGEETEEKIREQILSGGKDRNFWDDIRYFTPEEFRCKCGGQYCGGEPAPMREDVVRIAEAARIHFGRPVRVVSGLRCRQWNEIQGGVENSQHMFGEAVDLCIPGISAGELLRFVQTQPIRYAYAINDTNVHFDVAKDICAVAACISLLVKPLRERILGLEALREGQRCLLRSEILRLYYRNHAEKKLREFEFRNLEQCHRAYHALGGNSFVDHIHREMQEWEII